MTLRQKHRVWAEIDLDRLAGNYNFAKNASQCKNLIPVVKADAYGHGAVQTASTLCRAGAEFLAVATPEEALQLRRHGIKCKLLLLGTAPDSHIPALAEAGVTLCVPDMETARRYRQTELPLNVHIKFDTGMTRLGLDRGSAVRNALEIANHFEVTGLFTHFAAADVPAEDAFTQEQCKLFASICAELRENGLAAPLLHAANSAALLAHPQTHFDMTRPGLLLYGYSAEGVLPVLSLYSSIMQCRAIPAGTTVSYGRTWTARRDSVVATVPVGYADGLSWGLSGTEGACMLVRGQKAPLAGRVCMDFCIIDVTDIKDAAPGDIVTVLNDVITADTHAALLNTIPYEVLCSIGRRVPRVYRRNGDIIGETNDLEIL